MLISGLSESLSLVSTIPFFTLLSDPKLLWEVDLIEKISLNYGLNQPDQLFLPISFIFILLIIFTSIIRLVNLRLNLFTAANVGSFISYKCFHKLLSQNYQFYLNNSSSKIITDTILHINTTVLMIEFMLQLITSLIICIFLVIGLFLINKANAIIAFTIFAIVYINIAFYSKSKLLKNSYEITKKNEAITKTLQESLGSIRDLLINQSKNIFLKQYKISDISLRKMNAENQFLGAFPRFTLEGIGIIVLLSISISIFFATGTTKLILPIVGTLALGTQRLLPAMQMIYTNWATIKANTKAMTNVLKMLDIKEMNNNKENIIPIKLKSFLSLEKVNFSYENTSKLVLKNINLRINLGEKIGIIGQTGSGKSTLLDILMGLLEPTSGKLIIDNIDIYRNRKIINWRKSLSHVPQNVYLLDISLKENIALGIEPKNIDMKKIKLCSKKAKVDSFVNKLNNKYSEVVGERGSKLSGGQMQRIGIARSLYRNPQVLFLDEATSAVDKKTEAEIISSINNKSDKLTIISIAHNMSALKNFDRIFEIKDGILEEIIA